MATIEYHGQTRRVASFHEVKGWTTIGWHGQACLAVIKYHIPSDVSKNLDPIELTGIIIKPNSDAVRTV
jgi:hypothetical protein